MTVQASLGIYCARIVGEAIHLLDRPRHKYWRMHATKYLHITSPSPTHHQLTGVMHWSDDKDYWDYNFSYDKRLMLAPFEIDYHLDTNHHWQKSIIRFGNTLPNGRLHYYHPKRSHDPTLTATHLWKTRPTHLEYWSLAAEVTTT